jgi:hypothetical protein
VSGRAAGPQAQFVKLVTDAGLGGDGHLGGGGHRREGRQTLFPAQRRLLMLAASGQTGTAAPAAPKEGSAS